MPQPITVRCAKCHRLVPDRGQGKTCPHCGTSPVPSYSYPEDSGFYPTPSAPTLAQALREYRQKRKDLDIS